MPRGERGSVTIWVLGLCVCLLVLGGMSVDLWRVVAVRRDLAAAADAAAVAGADGLDPDSLRAGGTDLDPVLARELAQESLAAQPDARRAAARVEASSERVEVTLAADVRLGLLGLLGGAGPVRVVVHAAAEPRRRT